MLADEVRSVLSKTVLADGLPLVMDEARSTGSWLVDRITGKRYLDMFSMYASGAVGYNHPMLLERRALLAETALLKPTLSDLYTVHFAEFVEVFSRVACTTYLHKAFFIEGGALGVENALKAAFDVKVRKNLREGKGEKGTKVIHFKNAFHGRSGYTMSLTNTDPKKTAYFPKFDWPRISNPALKFPLNEQNISDARAREQAALAEINHWLELDPDDIAALIIEPIQAEGGDNHFSHAFIQALAGLCKQYDVCFIMDEVQTGVGITGKFWAHEHFNVQPDAISFGKKTQVCGMLGGGKITAAPENVFNTPGRINSTFGGNITDMARFGIILQIIEQEQLVHNAAKVGKVLLQQLEQLQSQFEEITNARGLGLMCAIDLPSAEYRTRLLKKIYDNGMIILPCGEKSIRFRPHLIVSEEEVKEACEIIARSMYRL